MKITDANGNTGFILARMWDGDRWVVVPERIMKADRWWIINYSVRVVRSDIETAFNTDNSFASIIAVINRPIFSTQTSPA